MRITTIEELVAYLRSEIVRIQAEKAVLQEETGNASSSLDVHLDGELAAVQKTLVMVSDDAFAQDERERALSDDRLRPSSVPLASEHAASAASPAGAAVEPQWPADVR